MEFPSIIIYHYDLKKNKKQKKTPHTLHQLSLIKVCSGDLSKCYCTCKLYLHRHASIAQMYIPWCSAWMQQVSKTEANPCYPDTSIAVCHRYTALEPMTKSYLPVCTHGKKKITQTINHHLPLPIFSLTLLSAL